MVKVLMVALGVQSTLLFVGLFNINIPNIVDATDNASEPSAVQIVVPKPQTTELRVDGYGSNPASAGGALQNAGPVIKSTDKNATNLQSPDNSQQLQPNTGQTNF